MASIWVECPDHEVRLAMPVPGILDRGLLSATHWFWQAIDLIYPPACISCGMEGERWCEDCQALIERTGDRVCSRCGKRLPRKALCDECKERKPQYTELRSFGIYKDPLRQAILRIKYQRDLGMGEILAGMMARMLEELGWQSDLIVPVPLSPAKLVERGYNQVDLFAQPLAWRMGVTYGKTVLKRVHEVKSQVNLSAESRRLNVSSAFEIEDDRILSGRKILLVDDVATTGSTADACSRILMSHGALEVRVATLARSMLRKGSGILI